MKWLILTTAQTNSVLIIT